MPRIMRFFCMGKVVEWDQPEFEPMIRKMGKEKIQGARAVILLDVFKVGHPRFFLGAIDVMGAKVDGFISKRRFRRHVGLEYRS